MRWFVAAIASLVICLLTVTPTLIFACKHPSAIRLRSGYVGLLLFGVSLAIWMTYFLVVPTRDHPFFRDHSFIIDLRDVAYRRGFPLGILVDAKHTWTPWFSDDAMSVSLPVAANVNFSVILFFVMVPVWGTLVWNYIRFRRRSAPKI